MFFLWCLIWWVLNLIFKYDVFQWSMWSHIFQFVSYFYLKSGVVHDIIWVFCDVSFHKHILNFVFKCDVFTYFNVFQSIWLLQQFIFLCLERLKSGITFLLGLWRLKWKEPKSLTCPRLIPSHNKMQHETLKC